MISVICFLKSIVEFEDLKHFLINEIFISSCSIIINVLVTQVATHPFKQVSESD
ncbi:unnamed protein product [Paramecium pentaurelia]|uniref:Uncharacterized protein n=1 Tax=Paramecium pentaurelia TaxID=43138 RepID=A0A8S1Y7C3_9CILI|nr:unnamed protein product [Paramecium pentaurelia]